MSYCTCLKCAAMVPWYDKYCTLCQETYGLPNLRNWQTEHFNNTDKSWDVWRKEEVERDLKKVGRQ